MSDKTVAEILSEAADILETRGFTTTRCYDPATGGYCALGAIARAVYPHATSVEIDTVAMEDVEDWDGIEITEDPRFQQAVNVAAKVAGPTPGYGGSPRTIVYGYNDTRRNRGAEVVAMLRKAAEAAGEELATV